MSADELIARSISRETFEGCGNEHSPEGIALSTLDIFNGLKNNNDDSRRIYDDAFRNYKKYSEHIFILTPSQSYVSKTYNTNYCEYENADTTKELDLLLNNIFV